MVYGDENPPLAGTADEIAMSARARLSIIRTRLNRCSEYYLLILRSFFQPITDAPLSPDMLYLPYISLP